MIQVPIYRIVGWEDNFENFRTRSMKKVSWIPQRVSFESDRIKALLRLGGVEAYGTFRILCAVAAVCEPRGTLMTGMGTPHTPHTLEDKTGVDSQDFGRAIPLCVNLKLIEISGHVEVKDTAVPASYLRADTAVPAERYENGTTAIPDYPPIERKKERKKEQQHTSDDTAVSPSTIAAAAVSSKEDAEEGTKLSEVVTALRGIGMDANVIPQLTASHPYPKILSAISMVKARGNGVKNRAGLVRTALAGGWAGEGGEEAYEKKRAAEHEERERRREAERQAEAKRVAERQNVLDTLAALTPDDFEALKDAAYAKMPKGLAGKIPKDSDPLEHGVWRSFMWAEHEKLHTSTESDDLIPGGV